jgi:hypothetical protein
MFILPEYLAQKPAVKQHAKAYQEHSQAQLIDEVHGAQVEVRLAIGVVLTEEITKGGAKIKQVFAVHIKGSWVCQGNTSGARKIGETPNLSPAHGRKMASRRAAVMTPLE